MPDCMPNKPQVCLYFAKNPVIGATRDRGNFLPLRRIRGMVLSSNEGHTRLSSNPVSEAGITHDHVTGQNFIAVCMLNFRGYARRLIVEYLPRLSPRERESSVDLDQ